MTGTHGLDYFKSQKPPQKLCKGMSCQGTGPQHDQDPQTRLRQQQTEKKLALNADGLPQIPKLQKNEGKVMPRNRTPA